MSFGGQSYTFQSKARPVGGDDSKQNIVFNNSSGGSSSKARRNRRRRGLRSKDRNRTPAPVSGRRHQHAQTSQYLEEIRCAPVEVTIGIQTDAEFDHPSEPLFIPKLSGVSKATQIEPGDLFNFDKEVVPILEIVVGKTLDLALMQVCEEEELRSLKRHKEMFEQRRNAEKTEVRRLQATQRRLFEEKERRKRQARQYMEEKKKQDLENASKIISKQNLQDLKQDSLEELKRKGVFEEQLSKFISEEVLGDMYKKVDQMLEPGRAAIAIVNDLMKLVGESLLNRKEKANQAIRDELQRRKEEREEISRLTEILNTKRTTLQEAFGSFLEDEELLKVELSSFILWKYPEEPVFPEEEKEPEDEPLEEETEEMDDEQKAALEERNAERTTANEEQRKLYEERKQQAEEAKQKGLEEYELAKAANLEELTKIIEQFKEDSSNIDYLLGHWNIEESNQINELNKTINMIENYDELYQNRILAREVLKLINEMEEEKKEEAMKELNLDSIEIFQPENLSKWEKSSEEIKNTLQAFIDKRAVVPEEPEAEENEEAA